MKTLSTIKAAIRASGRTIDVEESAIRYERSINLYLDSDSEQFAASDGLSICAIYYDEKGDRLTAIESLLLDLSEGFEPMTEDTKYSNGIG